MFTVFLISTHLYFVLLCCLVKSLLEEHGHLLIVAAENQVAFFSLI